MAGARRLGFKRGTFEFEDGATLECKLDRIIGVEISSEFGSDYANLDISFAVLLSEWSQHFEPEQLMRPTDLSLPSPKEP